MSRWIGDRYLACGGQSSLSTIPAPCRPSPLANRLAPRLWFVDATPTSLMQRDTASVTGTTSAVEGATGQPVRTFPPRVGPRPLAVALGLWVRWLRIPVRFSALFPLVIVLVTALFTAVGDSASLPTVVGGVLVFAGVYVS